MQISLLTILALIFPLVQPIPFGHFNPYGMLGGVIGAGGAIGGLVGGGLASGGQNMFFLNKYRQKKLIHHEIDHQHQSGQLMGGKFIGGGALGGILGAGGALGGGLSSGGGTLNGNYGGYPSMGNAGYDDAGGGGYVNYPAYPITGSESLRGHGRRIGNGNTINSDTYQPYYQRYANS